MADYQTGARTEEGKVRTPAVGCRGATIAGMAQVRRLVRTRLSCADWAPMGRGLAPTGGGKRESFGSHHGKQRVVAVDALAGDLGRGGIDLDHHAVPTQAVRDQACRPGTPEGI